MTKIITSVWIGTVILFGVCLGLWLVSSEATKIRLLTRIFLKPEQRAKVQTYSDRLDAWYKSTMSYIPFVGRYYRAA